MRYNNKVLRSWLNVFIDNVFLSILGFTIAASAWFVLHPQEQSAEGAIIWGACGICTILFANQIIINSNKYDLAYNPIGVIWQGLVCGLFVGTIIFYSVTYFSMEEFDELGSTDLAMNSLYFGILSGFFILSIIRYINLKYSVLKYY